MAGSFSDYLEDKLLKHAFTNTTYTPAATMYVGLYTAAPTDAGGGTQVSGGSYARVSVAFTVSGTSTLCTNSAAVEFTAATASWGTIVAVGVFDASTAGNLLAWADLTVNKTIDTGDIFRIPTGDLDITLS
jgi:threonine dehydrogenase-like Zn-dependent dehydrogenase